MRKDISDICLKCNVGEILAIETVDEGTTNENCVIRTAHGTFFLKYCKDRSAKQIRYVWNIERFMRKGLVPAIEAICVDESQGWMMYPFIESDRSHSYDLQDYFKMGQSLGRIHSASFGMEIPGFLKENMYVDNTDQATSLDRMRRHARRIRQKKTIDEIDVLFLSYIDMKLAYAEKIGDIDLPSNDTLIHGDFHPGNLLIDKENGGIVGICDWEKAQYAPRSYDVARSYLIIGFGTNVDSVAECLEISESFLCGYRSVIGMSDEEFEQGLLMRLRHGVFTSRIEDRYYDHADSRANKFLKNAMLTLNYFLGEKGKFGKALQ